jgi:hypothetical protein
MAAAEERIRAAAAAVLLVIVSPAGIQAFCHDGRSSYQPFSLVLNPDGVVVCTAQRFHNKG